MSIDLLDSPCTHHPRDMRKRQCQLCLVAAIADARAAGYAEAIEKAVKACETERDRARAAMDERSRLGLEIHGWQCRSTGAIDTADAIRALKPTTTTEEK